MHKRNPNQSLRIIIFVGSPIYDEESDLVKIAEILRKNKINVDIVSFGETEMNDSKLDLFFTTLNNNDNSHLIKVPTGLGVSLSDYLRQTPILPSAPVSGEGNGGDFGFDVNPNIDPELYEAMQLSRQTYEQETKKPETSEQQQDQPQLEPEENVNMYDDDVQEAIRLSLQTGELQNESQPKVNNTNNNDEVVMSEAQPQNTTTTEPKKDIMEEEVDVTKLGSEFFEDVLKDLDGVEMDNPDIQQLIMNFKKDEKKDKPEEKKD